MNAPTIPLSISAGVQTLDSSSEGWTLVTPAHDSVTRTFRCEVAFETPFTMTPVVHLGIVGLDVSNEDYARLSVKTDSIGPLGFTIIAETWFDSRVFRVDVSWLALGH